jgi:hypothetical protein
MAIRPEVARAHALCLLKTAIRAKARKTYGADTILVVVFDDSRFSPEDLSIVRDFCTLFVIDDTLDFKEVCVLGERANLFLNLQLPRAESD